MLECGIALQEAMNSYKNKSCVYNETFPWEYAAAATSGDANVSTLKNALKQFAKAYDQLCTAFYSEDPAIEDALYKVGFEYPFFAAPFEELGIDTWCANMLDTLNSDTKSMGESLNESALDARPNHGKLLELLFDGVIDHKFIAKNLMRWLPDDELGEFINYYELDAADDFGHAFDTFEEPEE